METQVQELFAGRKRWALVAQVLGRQFSLAHESLQRIQEETPEHTHANHEAFAIRNLQILSTEALDFLRAHFDASTAEARGEPVSTPEYKTSRWREVLDLTHPARPYNPYLGVTPELQRALDQTREALRARGAPVAAVSPTSQDPLDHHFALLTKRADEQSTERICSHESVGVLRALADLTNTAAQRDSTPSLRVVADTLSNQVKKLETTFLKCLSASISVPAGEDPLDYASKVARDYQNIGLLRSRMRADERAFGLSERDESRFLDRVSNEWRAYHLGIKPLVFFETLVRLSKQEIDQLHSTISESKLALRRAAPLYAEATTSVTIDAAVEPLLRTIDTARQNAPFLERHREALVKAGRAGLIGGLAYTLSLAPIGVLAIGETGIYQRYLGSTITNLVGTVANSKAGSVLGGHLQAMVKDVPKNFAETLVGAKLDNWGNKLRHALLGRFRSGGAPKAAAALASSQKESLRSVFLRSATRLTQFAWNHVQMEQQPALVRNERGLRELIAFSARAEHALCLMRKANKAFQELAQPSGSGTTALPAAYLDNCRSIVSQAEAERTQLRDLAKMEQALRTASGAAAAAAPRSTQYWANRYSLLSEMVDRSFADAQSQRSSTLGDRPLALIQVRHDPSPCDRRLWDMVNMEDRDASNASKGSPENLQRFHFGIRYHNGLPPTYHFHAALISALFPRKEDRAFAEAATSLLREPSMAETILRDLGRRTPNKTNKSPIDSTLDLPTIATAR